MKTTALIALAGVAAAATAQSANVTISIAEDSIASGGSFTVTVAATGTNGVAAFDILVNVLSGLEGITGISGLTGLNGTFFGAPATSIAGNLSSVGFSAAGNLFAGVPNIAGDLFSFNVATDASFVGTISFGATEGNQSASFVDFGTPGFPTVLNRYNTVNVTGDSIEVVPAPAAAGLLGLGGLVAARRRR